MARTPVGEEDPLLYVGSVNGERRVDTVTSSVLDRMRAVLRTIDAEEVQATVAIPHDKEEYFEEKPPEWFSFKKLWAFTGPGFLMSIAYLDPGNLESDLQAGAAAGYSLLWVLWWATVMGLLLQLLAARLGVVTGKHLAQICREEYPWYATWLLWLMTELAIIGSDIQEVIGSAIAVNILSRGTIPLWGGVLITAADTFTFLLLEGYGVRKLEALFGVLITTMAVTFGVEYVIAGPNQADVMLGLIVPTLSSSTIQQAVGMVGAVIMPHNIYLHSALVQSRDIKRDSDVQLKEANKYFAIESAIALLISFIINLFVVSVFAVGFYGTHFADNIGLHNAGTYLQEQYGDFALYVWAIGLLAAGQSSTMTGTYAGQFVMQGFLDLKIARWKRVMLTRTIAILPAVVVALTATDFLDDLDQWLNVLQAVQLPFALVPVLLFTNSSAIMGKFRNPHAIQFITWILGLGIIAINIYSILQAIDALPQTWWLFTLFAAGGVLYFAFIIFLIAYTYADQLRSLWRCVCCRGSGQTTTTKTSPIEEDEVTRGFITNSPTYEA
jgi:natural resistance-associated macrophage protein